MSIAPPSDIILDVAQAADPARLQAAVSKLAQAAAQGGTPPVGFDTALASATPGRATPSLGVAVDRSLQTSPLSGAGKSQVPGRTASPYTKFEAVLLRNFVENIMPKDTELFGDASSAEMCRSMFSEKIADELAKSGRFGIAKSIEHFEATKATASPPIPAKPS